MRKINRLDFTVWAAVACVVVLLIAMVPVLMRIWSADRNLATITQETSLREEQLGVNTAELVFTKARLYLVNKNVTGECQTWMHMQQDLVPYLIQVIRYTPSNFINIPLGALEAYALLCPNESLANWVNQLREKVSG